MSRIIAVFNQAVSVAKTTLSQNLGYQIAQLGHSVMLIDIDGQAIFLALSTFFPLLLLSLLLFDIERLRPLAFSHGIDITISKCNI